MKVTVNIKRKDLRELKDKRPGVSKMDIICEALAIGLKAISGESPQIGFRPQERQDDQSKDK